MNVEVDVALMVKEGLGTCDKTLVTQRDGLCLRLRLFKQLVVEVLPAATLNIL